MWPALYFDVETVDFHGEDSAALPCQLSAVLAGETRVLAAMSCLISVRHWEGRKFVGIHERAQRVHGITVEMCDEFGWPADLPLGRFRAMVESARLVVAHNIKFDIGVMDYAVSVQQLPAFPWPEQFCTMVESALITQLPSYGGKYSIEGFKPPKLAEAYRYFYKANPRGSAHDALSDTFNCRAIHLGILAHRRRVAEEKANAENTGQSDAEPGEPDRLPGLRDVSSGIPADDEGNRLPID